MEKMDNKVMLTVAPTGAWPSKKDTPYIPLQPKEIADDVYACWQAGASIAHLHVRDDDDQSSMDFDKFTETVEHIRATDCDIALNLTTSGQLGLEDEARDPCKSVQVVNITREFRNRSPEIAVPPCPLSQR